MIGHDFEAWECELHGHRMVYRVAGSGPPVVLVHGMINSSRHWREVALRLADRHLVIAPDLIGHGDSVGPRGDYSLGAHAARIRDLLAAIGVDHATMVGHSLGGGVAMQFFWQFPQRTDRLVLISSGGLGPEVSPMLRTAALPGASALLSLVANRAVVEGLAVAGARLRERGWGVGVYLQQVSRAARPLSGPGAREAFLQTLRSVIDVHGQRVSADDRLYLLAHAPTPTLVVWGGRDNTIPVAHGRVAHRAIPGSRFELLERAAHFPHLEDPEGLAAVLGDFLGSTEPAPIPDSEWGAVIAARTPRGRAAPSPPSAPRKATSASGANQAT
jgi:pimeloyl-ACP methyl ester carboxylesterase